MRTRIGSTLALIAVAAGLAVSVAGPVYSAIGGTSASSASAGAGRNPSTLRII